MPLSEERKAKMAAGRARAARERAEGLRPPITHKRKYAPATARDDDTAWMEEAQTALATPHAAEPIQFAETPEFHAAVADAVAAALESKTAEIIERLAEQRGSAAGGDASFARVLAAEITALVDRDRRGPARVPAKEMERRHVAREKMESLLSQAYTQGLEPEYEVHRTCYFDEQLIDPTWVDSQHVLRRTRISWGMVPNEALVPVNDVARDIFEAFVASIGGATAPINRPDFGRKSLKVHHRDGLDDGPVVGKGQPTGALKILGRDNGPGEIRLTNVLGTVAAPARQLA